MAHPLGGADLATLRAVFAETGGPDRLADRAGLTASALARAPVAALERAAFRLPSPDVHGPPLFLLGHWRSGTTHLINLLAAGGWGTIRPVPVGLPHEALTLGRLLAPLLNRMLPETRWIDRIPVTPDAPQEDEVAIASMCPDSFYHALYFPRHYDRLWDRGVFLDGADPARWERAFCAFLAKTARLEGRRLAIKNPTYTARPARLAALFPGAKFVHIHRDPLDVFLSMRNFHARLLDVMALQAVPEGLDVDATILRVYDRMMTRLTEETAGWGAPDFAEIAYADLDARPLETLAGLYDALDLPGFEAARPGFERHLEGVRSYARNRFAPEPGLAARLDAAWGRWFDRWDYPRPGAPESTAAPRTETG